jgi:hypothetical protein
LTTTPTLRRDEVKDDSRHDAQAYGNREPVARIWPCPAADQNQRSRPDELEAIYNHPHNMHPELIVCPSLPGEMGSLHLDPSVGAASRTPVFRILGDDRFGIWPSPY